MSPTWYNSPERIALLNTVAQSWIGTPFRLNSAFRGAGGGVSCHNLAAELYFESGFMERFKVPKGSPRALMNGISEGLAAIFDNYVSDKFATATGEQPVAGDLVMIGEGSAIRHLGVVLNPTQFLHVLPHRGVRIGSLSDPTFTVREIRRPIP